MVLMLWVRFINLLNARPEIGLLSSLLVIKLSVSEVLTLTGATLGVFIAVVTAIIRLIELKDKLDKRKESKES